MKHYLLHFPMKYKTFLPVFAGFYGTLLGDLLELEDRDYYEFDDGENELDLYDLDNIDYGKARENIARHVVDYFNHDDGKQFDFIKTWVFEKIDSPREYNFRNDEIDVTIECDIDLFSTYFTDNIRFSKEWAVYLSETFTSRSGFCSFWPNTPEAEEWEKITEENVGFILAFMYRETEGIDLFYYMQDVRSNGGYDLLEYAPLLTK